MHGQVYVARHAARPIAGGKGVGVGFQFVREADVNNGTHAVVTQRCLALGGEFEQAV
jgi:hypothetical protein